MRRPPEAPSPSRRGSVWVPGMPVLPPNTERHPVPGGGSRVVPLEAGDELTVVDREGLQPCELVAFGADGRADPGLLGASASGPAAGLQAILGSAEPSAVRVRRALESRGLDLAGASGTRLFDGGSRAGETVHLTMGAPATLWIGAPGGPMSVDGQDPPTEIVLYVHRGAMPDDAGEASAPAPLADPLLDLNIPPGEARGYEVKAGQYIQVVDLKGRECTDFQAFSLRALDGGREREIDPTTTRSLLGALYPSPGLYSKYFTSDQEPLLQIVQDTCGRHDTFGLACTARYYDDLGYPGHVNCTDNINAAADPFGIAPRGGWPAINYFFNTSLDDANAIGLDDPWSRPGDYVLVRALTDLVCFSTACPCDVDPANGWNPTDIQVRVYDAGEDFQTAVGYRMTTDSDLQMTRPTAFRDSFAAHTRDFVEYNGYWVPREITGRGAIEEYWACREGVVVMDLSPLRKYEVLGPDAEALLQHCVTRNMKKLSRGGVSYTAMCYEHGGMIDDGTVFRLGDDNFRWIGGTDASGLWLREQVQVGNYDAWVKTSTDQLCNLAVQGPKSRALLRDILWTAPRWPTVDELGWFRFAVARVDTFDGIPLVVSRTGYTGELGYELFCHPKDATALFDRVMAAGEPHGIAPFGLAALEMVRIEAGLAMAGAEFDDQVDPFEAGIGFTVPLRTKTDPFIGRAALERRKAHPARKLVGLELEGGVVPSAGDSARIGRAQVGTITSATRSPSLGKVIALCRMDVTHAAPDTELEVGQLDGHQKRIPARVVGLPHFDPTKRRVRGLYD